MCHQACVLLEGLNRSLPKLGIGKRSKSEKMKAQQDLERAIALREKAHSVKNDFWLIKGLIYFQLLAEFVSIELGAKKFRTFHCFFRRVL